MADMSGKWKYEKADNFDKYLSELGIGLVKRKMITAASPVMEIVQSGDHFVIDTTTTFTKQHLDFNAGDDFVSDMPGVVDGKFQCKSSFDGKKLVVEATPIDAKVKPTTTIRELEGDQLITTMTCGDVVCKRYFKRA